jgi:hypothetical protein
VEQVKMNRKIGTKLISIFTTVVGFEFIAMGALSNNVELMKTGGTFCAFTFLIFITSKALR